jgi:hypothetical protein
MISKGALLPLYMLVLACSLGTTEEDLVEGAEDRLVLPENAEPLRMYNRYYVVSGDVAEGIYISAEGRPGTVEFFDSRSKLPFVADGGCFVVHVRLNLKTGAWERPFCNGAI